MDTGIDFIRPEFLNILFFQQKNLVIFPYVDMKHLHALEIFAVGYTVIDLESTALHNIKAILEFEKENSYSQNPTLFFISNVNAEKVNEIMELDGIHCIINSNENVKELANGSRFIFFNKKNSQFLNYNITNSELEFEQHLISESNDEQILQDKIQQIKIAATRIFKELNTTGDLKNLPDILNKYDQKHWPPILEFTSKYYEINIPEISKIKFSPRTSSKDFSWEYELIISNNREIGKEFIQLMHDYREKHVNPANLELEELYVPQKLYNYLRKHHWDQGIPDSFLTQWIKMENSRYILTKEDKLDFDIIIDKLGLKTYIPKVSSIEDQENHREDTFKVPPPLKEWEKFTQWIITCLKYLKRVSIDLSRTSKEYSTLLNQISDLNQILKENVKESIQEENLIKEQGDFLENVKDKIRFRLKDIRIIDWINLYKLSKGEFIFEFFRQFSIFHDKLFNVNNPKEVKMPIRIKQFRFPPQLQKKMLRFNSLRNHLAHGQNMSLDQRNYVINKNQAFIIDTSLYFLAYILRSFVVEKTLKELKFKDSANIRHEVSKFIIEKYVKNRSLSTEQVEKINEFLQD